MGEMIDGQPMFPGDDTLDQLHQIVNVLGPFDEILAKRFYENPMLKNLRFPEPSNSQNLEQRYRKKIDKQAFDLLNKLLCLNEGSRITAEQALLHPYFSELLNDDAELMEEMSRNPGGLGANSSLASLHGQIGRSPFLNRPEKDDLLAEKENLNPKNQNIVASQSRKFGETELKLANQQTTDKGYFFKSNQAKPEANKRAKEFKMTDSFTEESGQTGQKQQRFQAKNKSENIDYKSKNRSKKFSTANSINFVIKKLNNFGISLYNPKDTTQVNKPLAQHKEKNTELIKSTFFRLYDVPRTTPSSNRLFPSIQNIKFAETKPNWNYKT